MSQAGGVFRCVIPSALFCPSYQSGYASYATSLRKFGIRHYTHARLSLHLLSLSKEASELHLSVQTHRIIQRV